MMLPESKYPNFPYSKLLLITIKDINGNTKEIEGYIDYYKIIRDINGEVAGGHHEWIDISGNLIEDEIVSWREK